MKVVILCGGLGTRIRDVSELIPKPMVPVGQQPIVWHIMKYYAHFGHKDFVLCLGYKKECFTDYFLNYTARNSDLTVELGAKPRTTFHSANGNEDWTVTLADTGLKTMTGSRLKRVAKYLDDSPFMLTYGDGLCDVDLKALLKSHKKSGKLATVSAVHPAGRFGEIEIDGGRVTSFAEKPQTTQGYINGGFMVFEREFIDRYIDDENTCVLEAHALAKCAHDGKLNAYTHDGFWQCMDTAREHQMLNDMWDRGATWKVW
jgi:glucose-1-phosphate cytidylyltransferase